MNGDFFFYNEKVEVDFICRTKLAIQVSYNISNRTISLSRSRCIEEVPKVLVCERRLISTYAEKIP